MRRLWGIGVALAVALAVVQVPSAGAVEIGLGLMAPGGAGDAVGPMVLAPHAVLELGVLGLGVDAWFSPGGETYFLLPFLQLQIPLALVKLYAGVAPIFFGGDGGITLLPPALGVAAKLGARALLLGPLGAYGEAVFGVSPLALNVSSASFVVGASFSF